MNISLPTPISLFGIEPRFLLPTSLVSGLANIRPRTLVLANSQTQMLTPTRMMTRRRPSRTWSRAANASFNSLATPSIFLSPIQLLSPLLLDQKRCSSSWTARRTTRVAPTVLSASPRPLPARGLTASAISSVLSVASRRAPASHYCPVSRAQSRRRLRSTPFSKFSLVVSASTRLTSLATPSVSVTQSRRRA